MNIVTVPKPKYVYSEGVKWVFLAKTSRFAIFHDIAEPNDFIVVNCFTKKVESCINVRGKINQNLKVTHIVRLTDLHYHALVKIAVIAIEEYELTYGQNIDA